MSQAPRYSSIGMALRLWRLLRLQWLTRAEIAAHLGMHERTVRRLLEALCEAGVPIQTRRRGHALEYGDRPVAQSDTDSAASPE